MSDWISIFLLVGCGSLIAVQATMNVALGKSLGLWFFAFVFTAVQLIATLPTALTLGWPPRLASLASTPWWQYVGGALGMPILAGMAFALGRTGTFAGLIALLVGQLTMGLLIDRFGLFQAPMHAISPARIVGIMFVVIGVVLAKQ